MNRNIPDIDFFPKVSLIVSNFCRMKCDFCCGKDSKNLEEIDRDNILKLIEILNKHGTRRICYTGGEPLLSPYIKEYLKKSIEYGMENMLVTSDGKSLNNFIVPSEYLTYVVLSIHGIGKKHDETTRIPNSFADIEGAIKTIGKKHNVLVSCVLTPKLKNNAEEMVLWCIENNIKKICFANLLRSGLGQKYIDSNGKLSFDDFTGLMNELRTKFLGKAEIVERAFESNAQCILIYSSGDIIVIPYFDKADGKKHIGNLFNESPKDIFRRFKNDNFIWDSYTDCLSSSSLFMKNKY